MSSTVFQAPENSSKLIRLVPIEDQSDQPEAAASNGIPIRQEVNPPAKTAQMSIAQRRAAKIVGTTAKKVAAHYQGLESSAAASSNDETAHQIQQQRDRNTLPKLRLDVVDAVSPGGISQN